MFGDLTLTLGGKLHNIKRPMLLFTCTREMLYETIWWHLKAHVCYMRVPIASNITREYTTSMKLLKAFSDLTLTLGVKLHNIKCLVLLFTWTWEMLYETFWWHSMTDICYMRLPIASNITKEYTTSMKLLKAFSDLTLTLGRKLHSIKHPTLFFTWLHEMLYDTFWWHSKAFICYMR